MDEFLKMSWRIRDVSDLEVQPYFIDPEVLSDSYVYKNLEKKIVLEANEKSITHGVEKQIPGPPLDSPFHQVSALDERQHQHCLNALKLHQSGKDPFFYTGNEKHSIKTYNELQAKIIEENRNYLFSVRKAWDGMCKNFVPRIRPKLFNYAKERYQKKLERYCKYLAYYHSHSILNTSFNEMETETEFNCVANLLEVGSLARLALPNLRAKCFLKVGGLPQDHIQETNSKLPVSDDENIRRLIKNNPNVDVVISGGSLKTILDATNHRKDWIIPVIIKNVTIEGQKVKKVVFIDNTLPKQNLDISDYSYHCHKILLRSEFCQYEAFDFQNEDLPVETKITTSEESCSPGTSTDERFKSKHHHKKIYHNVSYRLWSVKKRSLLTTLAKNKTTDVHINLLVRCKLDACELTEQKQLQPVIIRPKLEYQLQFGASIPSKMELSREWTSLFFRPYSNLYRVRVDSSRSEVVSTEKCSMQKINTEAQTLYDYRPVLGLGVLQLILEHLVGTEEGGYILRHSAKDGGFVSLMKGSNEKSSGVFDLHAEREKCVFVRNASVNPLPIDVNYILPAHDEDARMPGLFRPFIVKWSGAKNKQKGKKTNQQLKRLEKTKQTE